MAMHPHKCKHPLSTIRRWRAIGVTQHRHSCKVQTLVVVRCSWLGRGESQWSELGGESRQQRRESWTRIRGEHLSLYDNVKSKVRLSRWHKRKTPERETACDLSTPARKRERDKRARESKWMTKMTRYILIVFEQFQIKTHTPPIPHNPQEGCCNSWFDCNTVLVK